MDIARNLGVARTSLTFLSAHTRQTFTFPFRTHWHVIFINERELCNSRQWRRDHPVRPGNKQASTDLHYSTGKWYGAHCADC
uniref:Uncharacterized protein n=1 Tax=Timema tahoe TaxID=61484 RepID=A0A7R9NYP5_9NEOP|nr:unnamed protein product [Timema tahoe]